MERYQARLRRQAVKTEASKAELSRIGRTECLMKKNGVVDDLVEGDRQGAVGALHDHSKAVADQQYVDTRSWLAPGVGAVTRPPLVDSQRG